GIAFQLVDDLLDLTGHADALGKPVGGDLREGKMTLPLIHLLQQDEEVGARIIRDIIGSRSVAPDQWQQLLRILSVHRSIDYAYRRAVDFAERAKKPLYAFPPSSERDALLALPDYVLARDR
ncbi:MAG: polyprenyl synthetase family protein, partial [Acidobacteria bacterium]